MEEEKMRTKRYLSIIMAMCLLASMVLLAACGNSGSGSSAPAQTDGGSSSSSAAPPPAEPEKNPLDGLTIEWTTPNPAGDLFDTSTRLYAQYLQEYLPNTTIRVNNMEGGGGMTSYNYVYNSDKVTLASGVAATMFSLQYISSDPGVQYDMTKYKWVAYNDNDRRMLVTGAATGYKNFDELLDAVEAGHRPIAGCMAKASQAWNEAVALDYTFDINTKFVAGFDSSSVRLALIQGEVDFTCGSYSNYKTSIEGGEIVPLLVMGTERYDKCPDVPTIYEYIDALADKERAEKAAALVGSLSFPKLTFASPSTTDEQWQALCEAFEKVMENEEAMQLALDLGLTIPKDTGQVIQDLVVSRITAFESNRDELLAVFQDYLDKNF
jgi:tripartite-type tricarboxylate transporter receptor subunit TctC